MTRSPGKRDQLVAAGAEPVVCDVFDEAALTRAVEAFAPDAVLHQLTDLPDRVDQIPDFAARNDRIRTVGTRNLIAAATAAGARHLVAQSIAWQLPGREAVIAEHERRVLDAGGVVVRYGQLYGPGTFYEEAPPPLPRISVEAAARRTVPWITAASRVVVLTDDDPDPDPEAPSLP